MDQTIDRVKLDNGETVMLQDLPCMACDRVGCLHLVLHEQGAWAFCSWDCVQQAMRVNGEPLTQENAKAAGIVFIGPKPEA